VSRALHHVEQDRISTGTGALQTGDDAALTRRRRRRRGGRVAVDDQLRLGRVKDQQRRRRHGRRRQRSAAGRGGAAGAWRARPPCSVVHLNHLETTAVARAERRGRVSPTQHARLSKHLPGQHITIYTTRTTVHPNPLALLLSSLLIAFRVCCNFSVL